MFVIPCKFRSDIKGNSDPNVAAHTAAQAASGNHSITDSMVFKCVESIRTFHPDEKILVVDSDSDDLTYLEHLEKIPNVIAADAKNKNYLDGAIWYAVDKYPDEEWYCLLQDSITIKHSFGEFINGPRPFYSLMWWKERIFAGTRQMLWLEDVFIDLKYSMCKDYEGSMTFIGCWGPCFLAKREILQKLKNNNLHLAASKVVNKFSAQASERLWGLCLKCENIDIIKDTIDGDFLVIALPRNLFNSKTKYHKKLYGGRP